MTKYDPRKNAEGYNDPTPYAAEKHMMAQIRGKQARVAGGYFENIISASCDYYLSRGLAKIEKTPEPMKPLGAKNRKGQFLACYTKQAQPDYGGTLKGGRSINSTIALYKAYRKTRCGKRDNPTAMRYRMEAIERTVALSERLQRRDYSFGPYYPFKVYEPKERLVLAIDFEGKVVQHSLCDNVLEPAFSRRFIRDNYAGQIGKGTHDGLDRLAAAMRHYFFSRKAADEAARKAAGLPPRPMNEWDYADGWVLKGDFSKFFYTLLHSYCYETARRALKWLKDPELIDFAEWLLWLIIDSTPDPGIPIGNQSSQLLALLYLDAFDHWLRDDRGLVYGRYMDDFYIIHSDKLLLRQILKEIEAYIKPLGLRLNGKTQILPLKNGIDFLGFHTYLTQTGKVVRKVRAKSIDNMKRKIRKFRGLVDSGKMTLDSVVQSYASWTGHISHGNTYHLRQNMDAYFFSYFPELKPSPKGDTTHGPKTEQPRKQVEGQVRQPVRQPDRLDRGR